MGKQFDLVVRGGTLIDGTGAAAREADVAVKDGRIAAVGRILDAGSEEIDARGKLVTPGFVDIHTHYDGQATWDERMQPSSWHGVTTAVMGNCGVGFAPCRPADHDRLIQLMEGVEDIPFPVLSEGLPWNWESYPDYLDALAARRFDIDIGSQLPHAALRVYVMGERGANREPATPDDIETMASLAKRAVEAGAIGFSTSRTLNHRSATGEPTPTLKAGEDELTGIAQAIASTGRGAFQFISDFDEPELEFSMLRRICETSGLPTSFTLSQRHNRPELYRTLLGWLHEAAEAGLPMRAQVAVRAVGLLFGLELTMNPFTKHPSYRDIKDLPLAERVKRLSDPEFRAKLLSEQATGRQSLVGDASRHWTNMYPVGEEPNYEPTKDQTIAAIAERAGISPGEAALDHMLTNGGRGILQIPIVNYAWGDLSATHEMLNHPDTLPALSDGGAHVGMICDGSFPTTNIIHWTRDRTRGPKFGLERMIMRHTRDTARAVGLRDRGIVAEGFRADLNVIDYGKLKLRAPQVVYDMPAGGRRLIQRAEGYTATVVAGAVTYRDGEATGALPGRLVRGPQAPPVASQIAAE